MPGGSWHWAGNSFCTYSFIKRLIRISKTEVFAISCGMKLNMSWLCFGCPTVHNPKDSLPLKSKVMLVHLIHKRWQLKVKFSFICSCWIAKVSLSVFLCFLSYCGYGFLNYACKRLMCVCVFVGTEMVLRNRISLSFLILSNLIGKHFRKLQWIHFRLYFL